MTINQESGLIYPSYFSILTCYHPNQMLYIYIYIYIWENPLMKFASRVSDFNIIHKMTIVSLKKQFSLIAILERITSAFYYTICNLNQFVNHSKILFA
jgi:hypothetical protein